MAEILSQEEIEALLSSLSTEEDAAAGKHPVQVAMPSRGAGPAALAGAPPGPVSYEIYDFRRPDKLSKDQMRTLQVTHETFARLFSSGLSGVLRQRADVDLISADQVPYEEYMKSLSTSVLTIFSLEPLEGQALFEMDFEIIFTMIDRMLGGRGFGSREARELTEIERSLVGNVVDRALAELKTAWADVSQINPKRQAIETNPQLVQIVPPSDTVVQILYEAKIGDSRGAMSLCFPYVYLKPITSQLGGQRWYQAGSRQQSEETTQRLTRKVETTRIPCVVELGRTKVQVEEVLGLSVGDILPLERRAREDVDILIGGNVKFRARPGRLGRRMAVQITDLATPTG